MDGALIRDQVSRRVKPRDKLRALRLHRPGICIPFLSALASSSLYKSSLKRRRSDAIRNAMYQTNLTSYEFYSSMHAWMKHLARAERYD